MQFLFLPIHLLYLGIAGKIKKTRFSLEIDAATDTGCSSVVLGEI